MLKLNIISTELKKEIKYKFFYITLKNIFWIIILSIVSHTLILIIAKYILQVHANEINNRNILINSQTEDYNTKVKNINEEVDYISKIQEDTVIWSDFLRNLSKKINTGISITDIAISQKNNSFQITGYSKTRQALLDFKSELEDMEIFENVNIPIDTRLKKEDINFIISTNIKSYEFK